MSDTQHLSDYEAMHPVFTAIPQEEILKPAMPVDVYTQEAENLYHWTRRDEKELLAAGLNKQFLAELPVRCGACHEAQSRWITKRFEKKEAQVQWKEESPGAYDMRARVIHAFRYAFRNSPDLLNRVDEIADGTGHADLVQDLNDLAVLGRSQTDLLKAIKFDLTQLDELAATSNQMAYLLAASTAENDVSEAMTERNQAYTHLKRAVDEVRNCGQYVFWRNADRLAGYSSKYRRTFRGSSKQTPEDTTAPTEVPVEETTATE